ncbi:hypothetical protein SAY87_005241 [Trapa incisa]|uniref:Protein kinase domain-containing protein n=1 Tax=Trapa incisa TaxID=236973 RepID=A0AAN7K2L1_9MYRT|nr:hypothetical protein SAY87_005241 [Trapa incisa]
MAATLMTASITSSAVLFLILVALLTCRVVDSEPTQDKQALLAFLSQMPHSGRLRWNASASACSWVGVECDPTSSYVFALRLPGVGLFGPVPPATLGRLSQLRILSLRSNRISGELPSDFSNLTFLRNFYMQDNALSGGFPASLTQLDRLVRIDLSSNNLTGPIPLSVNNLTRLTGLFLQNNRFSGSLPSINIGGLLAFNVSNNGLNGSIPTALSKFPASAFAGNLQLCGNPLPSCSPSLLPPAPSPAGSPNIPPVSDRSKSNKLPTWAIIAIAVGAALLVLLLLVVFLVVCLRRRQPKKTAESGVATGAGAGELAAAAASSFNEGTETSSSKEDVAGGMTEGEKNGLVFFEGGAYSFELEDLLRASAEVLGKGSAGTSYKAVMEEGVTVVVKRLREVGVGKDEFEEVMGLLGKTKHENIAPIRAFYFSRDEKLLLSDYIASGSLSTLLHGSRGTDRVPLDWNSRLRIAIGAARGLAHLHCSAEVAHGNIKSSNILIDSDQSVRVSDFGLNRLLVTATPLNHMAGYRAPEVLEIRRVSFKSDVYSFGVLLLELLTGKSPDQATRGDEGIDLPRWVQSVVREEWTAKVFDLELPKSDRVEEMEKLLQIAISCVAVMPDQRPHMADIVRMMEEMSPRETAANDALRQSSDDPSKESAGQIPTIEPTTPPGGAVTP